MTKTVLTVYMAPWFSRFVCSPFREPVLLIHALSLVPALGPSACHIQQLPSSTPVCSGLDMLDLTWLNSISNLEF